jgi:hypothetical protein
MFGKIKEPKKEGTLNSENSNFTCHSNKKENPDGGITTARIPGVH